MNSHRMNLFWNYVPKNEYALERPSARHKGGLRSRLRKGRGRRAEGFREGRFGPSSSTLWNSMPKYDDWTVLSRYNHVKGLGSRMTKKRSDPNRNLYKISYNYSILEIAIYFQDPTKPSNAQRGHPVGHEESEKDDDEEMKREREREREKQPRWSVPEDGITPSTPPCPLRAIPLDCRAVARSAEAVLVFDVQNDGDGFRSDDGGAAHFAAGGEDGPARRGVELRRA